MVKHVLQKQGSSSCPRLRFLGEADLQTWACWGKEKTCCFYFLKSVMRLFSKYCNKTFAFWQRRKSLQPQTHGSTNRIKLASYSSFVLTCIAHVGLSSILNNWALLLITLPISDRAVFSFTPLPNAHFLSHLHYPTPQGPHNSACICSVNAKLCSSFWKCNYLALSQGSLCTCLL